jgi:hypothetical protein
MKLFKLIAKIMPISLLLVSNAMATLSTKEIGAIALYASKQLPNTSSKDVLNALKVVLKSFPLMPDAITIGGMARCQAVLGGCYAVQANFTFKQGKMYVSLYELYGVSVGLAEMTKIELYVSACYGGCIDDNAEGYFLGADAMAALGAGSGIFMDVGVDITELVTALNPHNILKYRTVYIGYGFDIGEGAGVSVGVYYYRNVANFYVDTKKSLW